MVTWHIIRDYLCNFVSGHQHLPPQPPWQIIFWQPVTFHAHPPTMRHNGFPDSYWSIAGRLNQSEWSCGNLIIYTFGTFGRLKLLTGSCAAALNIILHTHSSWKNSPSWTLVDYSAGGLGDREYHGWIEKLFNPSELLAPNPDAKRLSPLKLLLKKRMCHLKIPTSSNYSEGLTGWRYETLACPTSAGFLKSHFQKSLKGETEILRVDF